MHLTLLQAKRAWSHDFRSRYDLSGRGAAIRGQGPVWHIPVRSFNGALSAGQLLLDRGDISDRRRIPGRGLGRIVLVNVWTAVTFVSFFFALKYLAPASVGAIEVGAAVLVAVIATSMHARAWPRWPRLVVCAGIVGGCAVLAATELAGTLSNADLLLSGLALGASALAGIASAVMASAFKQLSQDGWRSTSILAHRFYLTIIVAIVWLLSVGQDAVPALETFPAVLAIGAVGVLLPLLLMQLALRRADTLTVMICMAFQPVMSFAFSLLSPSYDWSNAALIGILVVTVSLSLDIYVRRRAITPRSTRAYSTISAT
jgi:drug/metabolite transporter (DMT)-like permease